MSVDEKSTVSPEEPVSQTQGLVDTRSAHARRTEYIHYVTLCVSLFLAGWNDGTTGPLLPRIQKEYNVEYAVVSIIFIFSCIGFVGGAVMNVWLSDSLGFGKCIALGAAVQVAGYAIMAPAPPFPALVLGYFLNGLGLSFQDAQANGYVASLKYHAETKMGILHAVYGLGALVSPLVATQFANARHWSFHYIASCGIALLTLVSLLVIFRGRTQNECLADIDQAPTEEELAAHADHHNAEGSTFSKVMKVRAVHLIAFFILVYVGVEVTMGGWMVTFIINARGGGPSSGYVSSGFFGGLTLGRVALLWVNQKIGERRVIYLYSLIAIALDIVIWRVHHLVGDAVAVSFIGFVLGPMYPIAMNQASRILPPAILTGSIGWIAGFGQAGGALLPFITGALAGSAGITSLQPFLLAMMVVQVVLWFFVPSHARPSTSETAVAQEPSRDTTSGTGNATPVLADEKG